MRHRHPDPIPADIQPAFDFEASLPANERNLRVKAEAWIKENPHIYALFERFALELATMQKRFGVKLLAERVRWEIFTVYSDDEEYKINNNYVAYVARQLVRDHPELEPLIEFRSVRY